ncbi:hypothetical protein OG21DRAFT_1523405 [Imleria badia]|nr:hypothetical protein OG21DRAFT_1523405 [Imleria badia]
MWIIRRTLGYDRPIALPLVVLVAIVGLLRRCTNFGSISVVASSGVLFVCRTEHTGTMTSLAVSSLGCGSATRRILAIVEELLMTGGIIIVFRFSCDPGAMDSEPRKRILGSRGFLFGQWPITVRSQEMHTLINGLDLDSARPMIAARRRLRGRCESCFILKALLIARFRTYLLFGPEHGGIVVLNVRVVDWFSFHIDPLQICFISGDKRTSHWQFHWQQDMSKIKALHLTWRKSHLPVQLANSHRARSGGSVVKGGVAAWHVSCVNSAERWLFGDNESHRGVGNGQHRRTLRVEVGGDRNLYQEGQGKRRFARRLKESGSTASGISLSLLESDPIKAHRKTASGPGAATELTGDWGIKCY